MGLEVLMARDQQQRLPRWRYERLRGELVGEEAGAGVCKVRRQLRLRRRPVVAAGKSRAAPMLFRKRKVRLMRLVYLLLPARRVAALLAELVPRLAAAAAAAASFAAVDECPTIVFSSQWGLPVLSHSTSSGAGGRNARLRAFYLDRSLSSSSSAAGAAASPC